MRGSAEARTRNADSDSDSEGHFRLIGKEQTTSGPGRVFARLPTRAWLGLALIGVCWPLDWLLPGLRTQLLFAPLWLGYILAVDTMVFLRKGTSLWTRSRPRFVGLFVVSAPVWWLFELLNWRAGNWQYLGREHFTDVQFGLLTTLCFTTVIPAVFSTAELTSTFIPNVRWTVTIHPNPATLATLFVAGLATLALFTVWPHEFFWLLWISIFLIVEPVNARLGFPTLMHWTRDGEWKPILSLWSGVLICGFFWEMWNYLSFPKWTYSVPFVGFWHIFEMPVLGYGGYLPISLEVFAVYNLVMGLTRLVRRDYVQLSEWPPD